MTTRISVLMTCHNRRTSTLASLAALETAATEAGVNHSVFIVDDGSSDGTDSAVAALYPDATIIRADGSLYWNGGMRLAWSSALKQDTDFYLWLNDDLEIDTFSLSLALETYRRERAAHGEQTIICGRVADPADHETTYGGLVRVGGLSKTAYRHLNDGESLCDTFTGNFVLFPARVVQDIGILSDKYTHHWGDLDYGLRAARAGYRIVQTDRPVGHQPLNTEFIDCLSYLSASNWKFILFSPKGISLREWFYFCREHSGALWPLRYAWRYVSLVMNGIGQVRGAHKATARHRV